jgi:N-acetylglucosaminyldiphosphoundecaprenol N-acetyl-beta-D-mannosaminyltransferase
MSTIPPITDHFIRRITILRTGVDTTSLADASGQIYQWTKGAQSKFVVAANVHVVMTAYGDKNYQQVLDQAHLVTPDGMPLVFALKLLGNPQQTRVAGPDLMLYWCANYPQVPIFLYGTDADTLVKLETALLKQFPSLSIVGSYAPPFWDLAREQIYANLPQDLELIKRSGAQVIFVALGCPKQEFWMAQAVNYLTSHSLDTGLVFIGVGAAFAIHSGTVSRSPLWMQRLALEWVYRLWQEPRRLWRRYIINNPLFLLLIIGQILKFYFWSQFRG